MEAHAASSDGHLAVPVDQLADMPHQVGGHAGAKAGLKARDGKVFKPFQSGRRGEREHKFYERVFRLTDDEEQHQPTSEATDEGSSTAFQSLIPLIPRYFGVVEATSSSSSTMDKFLVLEDLTAGRAWPCIMDVKVGTRSYESDAAPDKIAYEKSKFPLQETVGFRLQGIKVFDAASRAYVELDKHYGRAISSVEELASALGRFLPAHEPQKRIFLIKAFLERLVEFEAWFDQQQEAEFIASSLLFLYNGEPAGSDASGVATGDEQRQAFAPDIRLIDFAHVTHPAVQRRDEGVRTGLRTLAGCFQQLLPENEQ